VYSALSLVAPASCSESVTVEIKKVHVGVILLRAQFNFACTSAEYVASRPSDAKFPRIWNTLYKGWSTKFSTATFNDLLCCGGEYLRMANLRNVGGRGRKLRNILVFDGKPRGKP
jgi:hypothetical protein